MIYPSIDKLLTKVGSKYLLVHVASRRSIEMSNKKNFQLPLENYKSQKNIGRALEEVMEDLVQIK